MKQKDFDRLMWINHEYGEQYKEGMWGSVYPGSIKSEYHKLLKGALKEIADYLRLYKESYEIRSNAGGIAVSGEVTLHGDLIYIQLSHGSFNDMAGFYRRCDGRKDYAGKNNNWIEWKELLDTERLADKIDYCMIPFRVID